MAVSIVGTPGTDSNETTTDFILDYGFSPTEGNLLIVHVAYAIDTAFTKPASYTSLFEGASSTMYTGVFYRIAGAAEPTSCTFTGLNRKWAGGVVEITGQKSTGYMDQNSTQTSTSATPTSPTITPTLDGCMIFAGYSHDNFDASRTVNGALSSRWNIGTSSGGSCGLAAGSMTQSTASATGAIAHTIGASQAWYGWTLAIAPESGASTVVPTIKHHHKFIGGM